MSARVRRHCQDATQHLSWAIILHFVPVFANLSSYTLLRYGRVCFTLHVHRALSRGRLYRSDAPMRRMLRVDTVYNFTGKERCILRSSLSHRLMATLLHCRHNNLGRSDDTGPSREEETLELAPNLPRYSTTPHLSWHLEGTNIRVHQFGKYPGAVWLESTACGTRHYCSLHLCANFLMWS